jgi:Bifunctional DNA primase/polymerase, N-terminal
MAGMRKPVIKESGTSVVPRFGAVAQQLVDNGYSPVPLHFGKKNPTPYNWTEYEFDAKHIRGGKFSPHRDDGTGAKTGDVVGLDIDVMDAVVVAELEQLADEMLGKAPRRIGQEPKVLRMYRTDEPFAKITGAEFALPGDAAGAKKHKVEVLGVGQQFVCYNIQPNTGRPYR